VSEKIVAGKTLPQWIESVPILEKIIKTEEIFWINQNKIAFDIANERVVYTQKDVEDAENRVKTICLLFKNCFS